MVIAALIRGGIRRYPFVFAYSVALFLATLIEIAISAVPQTLEKYYWTIDFVVEIMVFCVVIGFVDEAASAAQKPVPRGWLILAAAMVLAGSYLIRRDPQNINLQMTLISRDLNICAMIMDLILWSLLVTARHPNRRLMLLSGGLGLQLSGAVMGESLRHLSRHVRFLLMTGTLLEVSTGFLGLYIWWRALRTAPVADSPAVQRA
ncbi:MAG: hypothetical protein ACLP59_32235 [Bryobacteraceae bacterium]